MASAILISIDQIVQKIPISCFALTKFKKKFYLSEAQNTELNPGRTNGSPQSAVAAESQHGAAKGPTSAPAKCLDKGDSSVPTAGMASPANIVRTAEDRLPIASSATKDDLHSKRNEAEITQGSEDSFDDYMSEEDEAGEIGKAARRGRV